MAKNVFAKSEADNLAVQFAPGKFPFRISEAAKGFVAYQEAEGTKDFYLDPIIAGQTGVTELERVSIEALVEKEALQKFKDVEEAAHREGFKLGQEEGRQLSLEQHTVELKEKIASLESVLESMEKIKHELVTFNESHILKLIFYIARRVAMSEIQAKPEIIIEVIRQAVQSSQEEENIAVFLSTTDAEFIEKNREAFGREGEFLKRLKLEQRPEIQPGGCIVETNYGVVDSTIEQRVSKLWESLADKIPRVKDSAGSP